MQACLGLQGEAYEVYDVCEWRLQDERGDRAFYSPELDLVQLPPDAAFSSPAYWAATAVHEINHSTGHPSRMKRDLSGKFGSESYAAEEARVDMAAAFVCNTLNLPTDYENHAAYIATWLKKLRGDKRDLFRCAADPQKIADWSLGYRPDFEEKFHLHPRRPPEANAITQPKSPETV